MPQTITLKIPANIASQVVVALENQATHNATRRLQTMGTTAADRHFEQSIMLDDLAEKLQRLLTEHVNAELADMPAVEDSFGGDPWVDDEPGLHTVRQDREE